MGKNNKQRRAAKARNRARKRNDPASGSGRQDERVERDEPKVGQFSEEERVAGLFWLDQQARASGEPGDLAGIVNALSLCPPAMVAAKLEGEFALVLVGLYNLGWLPGEIIRQTKRATSVDGQRLVAVAVAADHQGRDPATLHPTWRRHVDELALASGVPSEGWLRSAVLAESYPNDLDWPEVIELVSCVTFALRYFGPLAETIPPPGTTKATQSIVDLSSQAASPILSKVRHLLAQAESTNFGAEAEAFTAKAQELMARHAIDVAMVWDRDERTEEPITIRIPIDDPYVNAKSLLVSVVAKAARCRAVRDRQYALVSLVGFESDLVWCQTLYTSLLVQAQHELTRVGSNDRVGGRRRSRGFRSSFLTSYAHRIGERLEEVNAHVQASAAESEPSSASLLPVLASRQSVVDNAVEATFGQLVRGPSRRISDMEGWGAGRQAADKARLTRGDLESKHAS